MLDPRPLEPLHVSVEAPVVEGDIVPMDGDVGQMNGDVGPLDGDVGPMDGDVWPEVRAVPAYRALRRLGTLPRIPSASEEVHALSQAAERIPDFWSLSCEASAAQATGTLRLLYSGHFAAVISALAALVVAVLVHVELLPGSLCKSSLCEATSDCQWGYCDSDVPRLSVDGTCPGNCSEGDVMPIHFWPFLVGFATYLIVMRLWTPVGLVFLDRVCIRQELSEKRWCLAASPELVRTVGRMLLVWDTTYFRQLQCTVEAAAFLRLKGSGSTRSSRLLSVVPIARGSIVRSVTICLGLWLLAQYLIYFLWGFGQELTILLDILTRIPFSFWLAHVCRRFAQERSQIRNDLRAFSCKSASSWCCTAKHVHPVTKATIPCDRTAIYAAVHELFGNERGGNGLEQFEAFVQKDLSDQLGHWSLFGFRDAVHMALPQLWSALSLLGSDCTNSRVFGYHIASGLLNWLGIMPLLLGLMHWLTVRTRQSSGQCDRCISVGTGLLWTMLSYYILLVVQVPAAQEAVEGSWLITLLVTAACMAAALLLFGSVPFRCRGLLK
mmetsp:Transcript_824/g.2045  ORF Transcript_824/g.2045 Transcript_824/m.2045 type:complete len:552 (-) Transcript_824:35-1690(-)